MRTKQTGNEVLTLVGRRLPPSCRCASENQGSQCGNDRWKMETPCFPRGTDLSGDGHEAVRREPSPRPPTASPRVAPLHWRYARATTTSPEKTCRKPHHPLDYPHRRCSAWLAVIRVPQSHAQSQAHHWRARQQRRMRCFQGVTPPMLAANSCQEIHRPEEMGLTPLV